MKPYPLNYDWLWGRPGQKGYPLNDGRIATIHATVRASGDAQSLVKLWLDEWLHALPVSESGLRGEGGWVARRIADSAVSITSAGEDVADGIDDGTRSLYSFLKEKDQGACIGEIEWYELPR